MNASDHLFASLLEPTGGSAFGEGLDWLGSLVFGSVAITLCVFAVVFVGMLMLTGRLALREGLRVTLGCFVLLGAPLIATAFV